MDTDEIIAELAESYINGNVSYVMKEIQRVSSTELLAYIAVGVYDRLADPFFYNKPSLARSYMNALSRHAVNART